MADPVLRSSVAVAVVTPYNVRAGDADTLADATLARPVMIYGASGALAGGSLVVQTGGAVTGTISFFGSGGVFDDRTGAAHAYRVYGGGGTVRLSGPGSSVTIANTQDNWNDVYADDATVRLVGAQAAVHGGGDVVVFESGAGNQTSLHGDAGAWNTVLGSGGLAVVASGNASVLGSSNTIYTAAGTWLSLYATTAGADQVYASSTFVILNSAAATVTGGGNAILTSGPAQVTLAGTNGVWDGVFGFGASVDVVDAQAAIFGGGETITATPGSWISLFATGAQADHVTASGANVILSDAAADVAGGGNLIYTLGASTLSLSATGDDWDTVRGSGAHIVVDDARASIIGDGDVISALNAFVSVYGTGGAAHKATGARSCFALVEADLTLAGSHNSVYLAGNSSLTLTGTQDAVYAAATPGDQRIAGFDAGDVLHLAAARWSDYAALLASGDLAQAGSDATIRLDGSHLLTLTGVSATALTAAQLAFD